ncbi:uncharacterized protein TRIVIDRAFT_152970, partial [Trichoderma virens Gv29-8]
NNYSSFFRENLTWVAAVTAYVALILIAMQVGLIVERLQNNHVFQQATYTFTMLAILGPVGTTSLVSFRAVTGLTNDLQLIFQQGDSYTNTPPTENS